MAQPRREQQNISCVSGITAAADIEVGRTITNNMHTPMIRKGLEMPWRYSIGHDLVDQMDGRNI